jgi:hypothetical protein
MNKQGLNDEAIAYSWFMLLVLLILGALTWMVVSMGFNEVMVPVNERITNGEMSVQTAGPITFGMGVLGSVPIFLIIGALIWAVLAGVDRRNEGG